MPVQAAVGVAIVVLPDSRSEKNEIAREKLRLTLSNGISPYDVQTIRQILKEPDDESI